MDYSFSIPSTTFTDANSDLLTYTAFIVDGTDKQLSTSLVAGYWALFDATTNVLSGTPNSKTDLVIKICATDGLTNTC